MGGTPSTNLPPAPTPPVQDTKADKIGNVLGAVSQGGLLGSISDAIARHHQKRQAEAQLNHDVMAEKWTKLNSLDPKDPEYAKTQQEYEIAHQAYLKSAGVDKDTKAQIQQRKMIADHTLAQGQKQRGQIPPMRVPTADQSAAAPPPQVARASGAVPAPPPAPTMGDITASIPAEQQQMADARKRRDLDLQSATQIKVDTAKAEAEAKAKAEYPTSRAPAAGAAPKVLSQEGSPYAVERVGADGKSHIVTPDDPEFTAADQRVLDAAKGARGTSEADKQKLQQQRLDNYASVYAKMRGQVQQYSVIDKQTSEPTMANANTINANPGRYMAGSLGQQLKNRASVFEEINYTKDQFDTALGKLTEDDFKALPRAQIALALKDRNPGSAMSTFIGSEIGSTLSPAQVEYVTGLASMQESAMS